MIKHKTSIIAAFSAICIMLTGCANSNNRIETVSDSMTIDTVATALEVDKDRLQTYFDLVGLTFDEFKQNLNASGSSIEDFKKSIETQCPEGATVADYFEFNIFDADESNSAEISSEFRQIDTPNSTYDIYWKDSDLKGMTFKDFSGSEIVTGADSQYNQLVLAFQQYGSNPNILAPAVDGMLGEDGYKVSVELLPNILLYGDSGKKLPEDQKDNPFFADGYFWTYGDDNELLEQSAGYVIGVHYYKNEKLERSDKDFYIMATNDFGFIIKTTSYEDLTKIAKLPLQVRYNAERAKKLRDGDIETETTEASDGAEESADPEAAA